VIAAAEICQDWCSQDSQMGRLFGVPVLVVGRCISYTLQKASKNKAQC